MSLDTFIVDVVNQAVTQALTANQVRPETVTPSEAATILGLAESTIRRLCQDGTIHTLPREITGTKWLISRNEIDRLLAPASTTPACSPRVGVVNGAAGRPQPAPVTAAAS